MHWQAPRRQTESNGVTKCKESSVIPAWKNCPFDNCATKSGPVPAARHGAAQPPLPAAESAAGGCAGKVPHRIPDGGASSTQRWLRRHVVVWLRPGFSIGLTCQLLSAWCDTQIQWKETCIYLKPQELSSPKLSKERKPSMWSALFILVHQKT